MATVRVSLGKRSYRVEIGRGLLASLGRRVKSTLGRAAFALVVADRNTARLFAKRAVASLESAGFRAALAVVPPGETAKRSRELDRLWNALAEHRAGRDAVVVALGGGVVGDLAGFAAATWNRGVDVVQVPTTLLAMVDAAIGGKTGINLPAGKNLVGAFHQPRLVLADLDTLRTLPDREYLAGLAEVVKYALIGDARFFTLLERRVRALADRDPALLARVVATCASHKARVVAGDEREAGPRMLLNFGHTFGHAVEAATGYRRYLHGEAVAIGMCAAARLTGSGEVARRVHSLLAALGLPRHAPGLRAAALQRLASGDKKARGGKIRYVVLDRIGSARVAGDIDGAVVEAAWRSIGEE